MIYGSVCSGIEAATVAWKPLGWKCAFMSEIEPFPRAVLQHHYPDVPLHGDFTTIQKGMYEPIDLLVGGTPCQSFSVAGLRGGLDDERGNLALEFLRLADRLGPRWLVWENVPGVLSSNGGRDFGSILGGMVELGYGFAYRVLDAQFFGVPQRRRRVFVIGCLGDWRGAAAVLFERHSLQGNPAPSREAGKDTSAGAGDGTSFSVRPFSKGAAWRGDGADNFAAIAHYPEEWGPSNDRRLTCSCGHPDPAHMEAQAFGGNDTRGPIEVATARNACASASGRMDFESETFIAYGITDDETVMEECLPTMPTPSASGGGHPPAVAFTCKDYGADAGDLAPTLRAMNHTGSHANAGGQVAVAIGADCYNGALTGELSATMGTRGSSETASGPTLMVAAPITASYGKQIDSSDTNSGPPNLIQSAMQVRRLTPKECERLQGFKDGYTLFPVRGKPAADGPRYKALGNSMAVPCMAWLGQRIDMVDAIDVEKAAA